MADFFNPLEEEKMFNKKLRELFKEEEKASKAVAEEVKRLYPVGTIIYFEKGRGQVTAEVLMNDSYRPQLRVRNVHSGNVYWIDVSCWMMPEVINREADG